MTLFRAPATLLLASLMGQLQKSQAFSSGAAACPLGQAAPGGLHLRNGDEITGSLADGGFEVLVDGIPAEDNMIFPVGTHTTRLLITRPRQRPTSPLLNWRLNLHRYPRLPAGREYTVS